MKKRAAIGLALLFVAALLLGGCGVSQKDYDAAVAQRDAAQAQASTLQADLAKAQKDYDAAVAQRDAAQAQVSTLQADLAKAQGNYDAAVAQRDALQAQVSALQGELEALQAKYPPKRFPSGEALQTWLSSDDISERGKSADAIVWLSRGLELQRRASEDGYIISVDLNVDETGEWYTVFCYAVVEDGGYWWWDPEKDDVYYWLDVRKF